MPTNCTEASPRVEWDAEARAVYLRLQETPDDPEFFSTQITIGNVVFDVNWYDHCDVYGVEMLNEPNPEDKTLLAQNIRPSTWVLIGKAWERASIHLDGSRTSGYFLLPHKMLEKD